MEHWTHTGIEPTGYDDDDLLFETKKLSTSVKTTSSVTLLATQIHLADECVNKELCI